jgi:hypothetical protein
MSGRAASTAAAASGPTPPARTDPGGGEGAVIRRWLRRRWARWSLGEDASGAGP